ncbi:MAG: flagellar hook-associated protein FlgL [Azoarcus sp.]|jgi:flagellar hook-associated protein 3 FlgL|nr:flagellar hook-associated protein FlgL [Azoarcus sp.]
MRVSTNMIYDRGIGTIQQLWSSLLHAQQEIATGRRILTPADDPVAASRALDVNKSRVINAQYKTNLGTSTDNLRLLENKLMGVGDILQYMREGAVGAGNGILTQKELDFFVIDMRNQFDSLLSLANTKDVAGNFLFSGYKADVQPFQGAYGNISYEGDQGTRTIQVSSSRFMPVSLPGSDVFDNTRTMAGAINVFPGSGNSAGASVTASFNPSPPAEADIGRRYEIVYNGPGSYEVFEYVPGGGRGPLTPPVVSASPNFSFNGIDVDASGLTVPGESAEIFIASKNVFENLALFIDTLENPGSSGVISGAKFAIQNIDHALDTELRVRAQIGSQLVELEQLGSLNADMDIQYGDTLNRLEGCDYAEAISRLTRLQTNLEASQMSFMRVSGLSLFNYLR